MDPVEHLKSLWVNGTRRWQNRDVKTYAREQLSAARDRFMQGIKIRRTPGQQSLRKDLEFAVWEDNILRERLRYYQRCRALMAIIKRTENKKNRR